VADQNKKNRPAAKPVEAPKPVEVLPRPLVGPELVEREAAVTQARERALRIGMS
jgi:hypothetical protein